MFRWGIFLLACVFLYEELAGPKGIAAKGGGQWWGLLGANRGALVVIGGIMVLNWWVESAKWRLLVWGVEPVSRRGAFVATIAGTSVAFVSVNRTGEFLGRVLFLAPDNRIAGGFATALGSIAQFVVTLFAGGVGLVALTVARYPLPWPTGWFSWTLATLTALVTAMALVLYVYPSLFRQVLLQAPFMHRFGHASAVLARFQRSELLMVLLLSATRYLLFTFQFMALLWLFGAGVGMWSAVLGVPLVYLLATLIPSVMLTELGVRGSVAVAVFGPMGGEPSIVLLATTCLWLINVALPACVGSVILVTARIRTRQSGT